VAESSDLEPLEWLARLGKQLLARRPAVDYWRRYYEGDHDLPSGPSQHKEAFERFQRKARTNLCLLAVESMVHRMRVVGVRPGGASARTQTDNPVWALWQAARLDARQFAIYRKAASRSAAYAIVGVDPRDSARPLVTIEGPETVIVETDPADPTRRLAALRLWHDGIANRWLATLWLPGVRHHWQTVQKSSLTSPVSFKASVWEERTEPARSLPGVPVVPFLNGDEDTAPVAEFDVGLDIQDRLNLTVMNRLTAERYAAFRQNALMNFTPEEDPVTGLPVAPFRPGADQIWTIPPGEPGDPETKLVSLPQTDTSNMLRAVEADMRAFAAVTLTPVYYLPGDMVNIGADAIAALDAGHVSKVIQRTTQWGEGLEEVLQLMADVAGLDLDLSAAEIVWARPENFNPGQVADYATKLTAAGYPLPIVAERIGDTPQQVDQLRAEMAASSLRARLAAPPEPPAPARALEAAPPAGGAEA
jgi:hypothetical protein